MGKQYTHTRKTSMRNKLGCKTSSTHKELAEGGKQIHQQHVNALKEQLNSYEMNPSQDGPARVTSTGY